MIAPIMTAPIPKETATSTKVKAQCFKPVRIGFISFIISGELLPRLSFRQIQEYSNSLAMPDGGIPSLGKQRHKLILEGEKLERVGACLKNSADVGGLLTSSVCWFGKQDIGASLPRLLQ